MNKDVAIRKLMQACEKDPDLFTKLVDNPQEIAKEHDIALEPEELQQLQRVKKLKDLVEEFKQGRGIGRPVGYPIDVAWTTTIANHIIFYRPIYYPIYYPIFYPVFGPISYRGAGYPAEPVETAQFSALRKLGRKRRP
ncbi:MAG: hypothetical protein ABSG62_10085 [Terracidiphilus sp.]|jgi:hypothetical protein